MTNSDVKIQINDLRKMFKQPQWYNERFDLLIDKIEELENRIKELEDEIENNSEITARNAKLINH